MIQGTGSHVGKSLLVAALCRIFRRRGLRVAPFKAQNMALNAHVTFDGKEMGRAQAMQAEAAGVPPTVEMNPLLLKATSHTSAQVILMGEVVGEMGVLDFRSFKARAWEVIREAYRSLSRRFDLILIEGAGSPAEINLKRHDIVNMRVAEMADAPVLLVGDIDRGGMFASLVGTMDLLTRSERERVAGFLFNKFRGDPSLLTEGIDYLQKRFHRPVVGVIPYLEGIHLPEEDGVALERDSQNTAFDTRMGTASMIGVIRLPHISNFTDFDPFRHEEGVRLTYLEAPSEIGTHLRLLILPGTKQTIGDLVYLRERGWEGAIRRYYRDGGHLIGICGGYQILGEEVADPHGVEGPARSAPGLGFLPVSTVLQERKRLAQVRVEASSEAAGLFRIPVGMGFEGYEMHMGKTHVRDARPALFRLFSPSRRTEGRPDGVAEGGGGVWGSYVHGLFDNDLFRQGMLQGCPDDPAGGSDRSSTDPRSSEGGRKPQTAFRAMRDQAIDRLADAVEASLNMKVIDDLL